MHAEFQENFDGFKFECKILHGAKRFFCFGLSLLLRLNAPSVGALQVLLIQPAYCLL